MLFYSDFLLAKQSHSATMAAEASHRRAILEAQGFDVIGAKIDKRTGKHTIIYRGETRIPSTPPRKRG